ncbi:MAG: BlaI/MecI/CopY family transcriptional regulator [Planctomycetota bacterium]
MNQPHDTPRQLTARQLEIMEVIWARGEASALEVRDELAQTREVARNTVRTTMERLEAGGWLTHRVVGRTRFYAALIERQATVGEKVLDVIDRVCGGRPERLMSALVEHRGLKPDEIDRIEALLEEARARTRKKGTNS